MLFFSCSIYLVPWSSLQNIAEIKGKLAVANSQFISSTLLEKVSSWKPGFEYPSAGYCVCGQAPAFMGEAATPTVPLLSARSYCSVQGTAETSMSQ